MATRYFTREEARVAWKVFRNSLPYTRIRVTDKLGLGGEPYVMNSGTGRNALFYVNYPRLYRKGLHGLETFYQGIAIHELTHVWQGEHSSWTPSYLFKYLLLLMKGRPKGKFFGEYEPGKPWNSYDVEQQAAILCDWYLEGMQPDSPLFRYVKHVRAFRAK